MARPYSMDLREKPSRCVSERRTKVNPPKTAAIAAGGYTRTQDQHEPLVANQGRFVKSDGTGAYSVADRRASRAA
jgi:hypothetical protein